MAKKGPSISAYKPGLVEGLMDATVGAATRQAHRAMGRSERDAYRASNKAQDSIETLTGWKDGERSIRNIAGGRGGWRDYASAAATALPLVGGKVVRRALRAADEAAPALVRNELYSAKIMGPKYHAADPKLPKYAHRNISHPSEIEDIAKSGYMRPREGGKTNKKYFTASDNPQGNPANLGGNKPVLRVQTKHIPEGAPVKRQHVEMHDPKTDTWKPVPRMAKGGAVSSSKCKGDGCAKRGKTRGRMI